MSGTVRTVEVSDHQERVLSGQVAGDGLQLQGLVIAAEAEMQVRHRDALSHLHIGDQAAASLYPSGKLEIMDIRQGVPAEDCVPVQGNAGNGPVALDCDMRVTRQGRDLLGLAGETGAAPAQIDLLQADHIMRADDFRDFFQRGALGTGIEDLMMGPRHVL